MNDISILLMGDVMVHRNNPVEPFQHVRPIFANADMVFANLECSYTDEPEPIPSALGALSAPAHNLAAFADAGFHVLSLANNHTLDVGYKAMLETRMRLREAGVQTCGAGATLADARTPALIDCHGIKVAFLAYSSIFPVGCEARSDRAGIAPMRAHIHVQDPVPTMVDPCKQLDISTVPDAGDLAALADDIKRARDQADLVITSFHWGDYTRPYTLSDHEKRTARYCIDQGADLVVGHHHHMLRGMEWYNGKPIMYGLGHFVFDHPLGDMSVEQFDSYLESVGLNPQRYRTDNPYYIGPRQGWPMLPMHEDARLTVIACAVADKAGVKSIGFIPCKLTSDGAVSPFSLDNPNAEDVIRYMKDCIDSENLDARVNLAEPIELPNHVAVKVEPRNPGNVQARVK